MSESVERDGDFAVRSNEISRIEGLSDSVFGFAITLLVVSLGVPKASAEALHAVTNALAQQYTGAADVIGMMGNVVGIGCMAALILSRRKRRARHAAASHQSAVPVQAAD
jgi:hypothetical protein